jgi:cellulose synthase/poly-beta-1,6-N-acetylglucosamine synthase-like glycosyltransferase
MDYVIVFLYCFFLTFIFVYSISQLSLTVTFLRRKKREKAPELTEFPMVTVQLPIYNEKYVIERLIRAVADFEYPKDKLEIQILDDSNDETIELVANVVREFKEKGFNIKQVIREDKIDFKAGALKYGTEIAEGEFIAIFDADFIPEKKFLLKTLPHFKTKSVGLVQTRWGHLNENYSLLTKLQSYALNAHFTVEQSGRNSKGFFINFNGTAGIWRKKAIITSGGWQGDTLTEDIDLSYRSQLNKWDFVYLEDVVSPAELPAEMNSLRSQQYRWAKGAAECTKKNLSKVLKRKDYSLAKKMAATLHLTNSFMWICLFASAILLMPFLSIITKTDSFNSFISVLLVYQLSFFLLFVFYLVSNSFANIRSIKDFVIFILLYPVFLSVMMGLALNNTIGTIKGYLRINSPFVRTPKFNIVSNDDSIKGKSYVKLKLNSTTVLELISLSYFIYATIYSIQLNNFGATAFMLMMCGGIILVMSFSVIHFFKSRG